MEQNLEDDFEIDKLFETFANNVNENPEQHILKEIILRNHHTSFMRSLSIVHSYCLFFFNTLLSKKYVSYILFHYWFK